VDVVAISGETSEATGALSRSASTSAMVGPSPGHEISCSAGPPVSAILCHAAHGDHRFPHAVFIPLVIAAIPTDFHAKLIPSMVSSDRNLCATFLQTGGDGGERVMEGRGADAEPCATTFPANRKS
jgi:hypothetical protein